VKITLEVTLYDSGPDVDVRPDRDFLTLGAPYQQALIEEAIRSLQHYITMITLPEEVSSDV
jgi:hypothetical protein